jgi:hypothetical protein
MTSTACSARSRRLALTALALLVLATTQVRSDDKPAAQANPFEGAWRQVEQKNGNATEYQKLPDDSSFTILVTGGRFVWTVVQGGKVVGAAGGKVKVENGKYSEIIEFVHGPGVPESFVGSTFEFTGKVEGDKWHKVGTIQVNGQDFKIDEKWERCPR